MLNPARKNQVARPAASWNRLSCLYRLYLLAACWFVGLAAAHGQNNSIGYYRQGEKLFAGKNYYEAAQYYEKFLGKDTKGRARAQPFAVEKKVRGKTNMSPRQEAIYHLAECYRQAHDYVEAEKWYKLACAFPQAAYPERQYWYGVALRANGKYADAIEAFTAFEKEFNDLGPLLTDADKELGNLRFIQAQLARKNKNNFILTRQMNGGNTEAPGPAGTGGPARTADPSGYRVTSSYALSVLKDDTVVFTSIHTTEAGGKKPATGYTNDLFLAVLPDQSVGYATTLSAAVVDSGVLYSSPVLKTDHMDTGDSNLLASSTLFATSPGDGLHNGLASFSADGTKMFFTRWTKKEGVTKSSIWRRDRSDSGWSVPVRLEEPVNLDGYNSAQPFITTDNKHLIFSSDREGGYGKYDLWYADLDSNFQAYDVANAGERINTPGDEEAPYYHQNSRTLVFSSNGRVGMGGFDIYYSRGNFNLARWENPTNPGIPINSSKDDIYFVSTDEDNCWNTGWLSSDRHTGCCLALYNIRQDNTEYISGIVEDCDSHNPIPGAKLVVSDAHHGGKIIMRGSTDSTGRYHFYLKNVSRFRILSEDTAHIAAAGSYLVRMEAGQDSLLNEPLCMRHIPAPPPDKALKDELAGLTRSSVLGNFPYKKSSLPASAYVSLDSLVSLMNRTPGIIIQVEGYTDGIGGEAYNIRLAQARVDACIRYLCKKGIPRNRLRGKSFGKCCPIEPDKIDGKDNPAGREKNRRVEYKLVK